MMMEERDCLDDEIILILPQLSDSKSLKTSKEDKEIRCRLKECLNRNKRRSSSESKL